MTRTRQRYTQALMALLAAAALMAGLAACGIPVLTAISAGGGHI